MRFALRVLGQELVAPQAGGNSKGYRGSAPGEALEMRQPHVFNAFLWSKGFMNKANDFLVASLLRGFSLGHRGPWNAMSIASSCTQAGASDKKPVPVAEWLQADPAVDRNS